MCLSTVYEQSGSERKMLARNVESVNLRDGKLVGNELNERVLPARELTW